MIDYFQINAIVIGPVTLQVWGIFVSLGIGAGLLLSWYWAKKLFLSTNVILDIGLWSVVGGILGARIGHILFYNPQYYLVNPFEMLALWHGGSSSLGGFIGAGIAVFIWTRIKHFSWLELLPYLDIASLGLWLGWAIGRIGCFFIHDHPGQLSRSFLAVAFFGGARYDLGLLDSILALLIFVAFQTGFKKMIHRRWGLVAGFSFFTYAFFRFFLDFLRATDWPNSDVRYFSLTPAQWGMIVVVLGLTFVFVRGKMRRT